MYGRCPTCATLVRLQGNEIHDLIECPECKLCFRVRVVGTQEAPLPQERELYFGIDVSTSIAPHLPHVYRGFVLSMRAAREQGPFQLAIYLFNRHVMPYPSERLCGPVAFQEELLPTLNDLQQRVGGGTALLDTLNQLLDHAIESQADDRRIILLTDGWERSSQTSLQEVRSKLDAVRDSIPITLLGFVDQYSHGHLQQIVSELGLPHEVNRCAIHDGEQLSIADSIDTMTREIERSSTDIGFP